MYKLVISGYYGFGNAGDEAMLTAMIEALTQAAPDSAITVLSGNPAQTRRYHGVQALHRLDYPGIVRTLRDSDLLISGGGSLLQDVTSDRSLYYYLSIIMLAQKLAVPVMLYAQGIGPVRGRLAQAATRCIGNAVNLITVRDEGSRQELGRLGVHKPPVYVTADPVLALNPVDKGIGRALLKQRGVEPGVTPLVGLAVREWQDWGHYKNVLAQAADKLARRYGARLLFLPMQQPEDEQAAARVAGRLQAPAVILRGEYSTTELLSIVGNLDLLLGIRLHALIFAAIMGVPFVALSYDPKVDRFMASLGLAHAGTLQDVTARALLAQAEPYLAEDGAMPAAVPEKLRELRRLALQNAELAIQLVEKSSSSGRA